MTPAECRMNLINLQEFSKQYASSSNPEYSANAANAFAIGWALEEIDRLTDEVERLKHDRGTGLSQDEILQRNKEALRAVGWNI